MVIASLRYLMKAASIQVRLMEHYAPGSTTWYLQYAIDPSIRTLADNPNPGFRNLGFHTRGRKSRSPRAVKQIRSTAHPSYRLNRYFDDELAPVIVYHRGGE